MILSPWPQLRCRNLKELKMEAIKEALAKLDPANDDHWTPNGLPALAALRTIANDPGITRKDVELADPGFMRPGASKDAAGADPFAAAKMTELERENERVARTLEAMQEASAKELFDHLSMLMSAFGHERYRRNGALQQMVQMHAINDAQIREYQGRIDEKYDRQVKASAEAQAAKEAEAASEADNQAAA
jgi:hypothetical protein